MKIGGVELSCDYDYYPEDPADEQGIDPPTPAYIENLTVWLGGEDVTELLAEEVCDRIYEKCLEEGV